MAHHSELLVERAHHVGVQRLLVGNEKADLHVMILLRAGGERRE
jgi:hypothetical protein